jgi:hypothetical protein
MAVACLKPVEMREPVRGEPKAQRLKDDLYKSEQAVQQYRQSYQAVSLEEKQKHHCTETEELKFKVIEAKSKRLKLEAGGADSYYFFYSAGDYVKTGAKSLCAGLPRLPPID